MTLRSLDVPRHMLDRHAVHLVCEDPRLSLQRVGVQLLALDMSQQQLRPIELDLFDFMLDVSAAMMDFPETPVGPQNRTIANRIFNSAGSSHARSALRARM